MTDDVDVALACDVLQQLSSCASLLFMAGCEVLKIALASCQAAGKSWTRMVCSRLY
jgi:hypothetical protein